MSYVEKKKGRVKTKASSSPGLNLIDASESSVISSPNKIVKLDANGKLDQSVINLTQLGAALDVFGTYSVMTVGASLPGSPIENQLFYNTSTKKLYKYMSSLWIEIDWQRIVNSGPEKAANRLQIISDQLQISPDGVTWYDCIPAVGAKSIEIQSYDNSAYSNLYYILPGTTVVIRNANHIPLVFTQSVRTRFNIEAQGIIAYGYWVGLRPNNSTVSNGDGQLLTAGNTSVSASRSTSLNIVPLYENGGASTDENRFNGTLHILNNKIISNSIGLADSTYYVGLCNISATIPSTTYWLGTWYTQAGTQFTVESLSIERRA